MRLPKKAFALATAVTVGLGALPGAAMAEGTWERLWGQDAYDTMQAVVEKGGAFSPDDVDTVILATGEGYHDALSASGIAGIVDAPVLITPTKSLGEQARLEIERLAPSTVFVVGGPLSVDESVVDEVRSLGVEVERLSGQAADDTAVESWRRGGAAWGETAVIAASSGYWDALAAAPYAYWADAPVFLTGADGFLSADTLDALANGGFKRVLISGGPLTVREEVEDQLIGTGLEIVRRYGPTALETSAEVAAFAIGEGMDEDFLTVASASTYHDALTGAALAGEKGAPLVLVDPEGGVQAYDTLREQGAATAGGFVFGGPLSVSEANYEYLANGTPLPEDDTTPEDDKTPVYETVADAIKDLIDKVDGGYSLAELVGALKELGFTEEEIPAAITEAAIDFAQEASEATDAILKGAGVTSLNDVAKALEDEGFDTADVEKAVAAISEEVLKDLATKLLDATFTDIVYEVETATKALQDAGYDSSLIESVLAAYTV